MKPTQTIKNKIFQWAQVLDKSENLFLNGIYKIRFPLFIGVVTLLSMAARMSLWPFVSGDYREYLGPWLDTIRSLGGIRSIGTQIGDYSAPYHYLLALMTYTPFGNHAIIKITSTAADFVLAFSVSLVCWQLLKSKWRAAACYAIVLCLPTVFLNSAAWGQCDGIYTALLMFFFYLYLIQKKNSALFVFGVALAVKLQAIFFLPALLILWLCGRIRIRHMLFALMGYFVMFVPAMIGAKNFSPLFRAYEMQASLLSLFANIYNGVALFSGIDERQLEMLGPMLIGGTIIAVGIVAVYCWQNKNKFDFKVDFILFSLCALLLPFLLPAMKDRYYYSIEVMTVVYALLWPRRLFLPLFMQLVSIPAYMYYLTGTANPFQYWLVPVAGIVLVVIFWDLYNHLQNTPDKHKKTVSYHLSE